MSDKKHAGYPHSIVVERSKAAYVTKGSPVSFGDIEVGKEFFRRFHNKLLPNVCKVIWSNDCEPVLWLDEEFVPFDPHTKFKFGVWEYSQAGGQIISMGRTFVKFFNGVIAGLNSLFESDWHHGDLIKGVAISKDFDVRLFNIAKQDCDMSKGSQKDLKDLMTLVQTVINSNPDPYGYSAPGCVALFFELDDLLKIIVIDPSIRVTKWKFMAYFIFNSPIFANQRNRIVLIKKFINLRKAFEDKMDVIFAFKNPPAMNEWWARRVPKTFLYQIQKKKSIIDFYTTCLRHKDEKSPTGNDDIDEVAVEYSLSNHFPDFLPKAYYVFIRELAGNLLPEENRKRYNSYFEYFQMAEPPIAL